MSPTCAAQVGFIRIITPGRQREGTNLYFLPDSSNSPLIHRWSHRAFDRPHRGCESWDRVVGVALIQALLPKIVTCVVVEECPEVLPAMCTSLPASDRRDTGRDMLGREKVLDLRWILLTLPGSGVVCCTLDNHSALHMRWIADPLLNSTQVTGTQPRGANALAQRLQGQPLRHPFPERRLLARLRTAMFIGRKGILLLERGEFGANIFYLVLAGNYSMGGAPRVRSRAVLKVCNAVALAPA
ncbi:hypothetical protein F5888DRAFT_1635871 [Russula emetica]|nr:hypothetical protein F5888DRAFT_1635871 [Russula emetica]